MWVPIKLRTGERIAGVEVSQEGFYLLRIPTKEERLAGNKYIFDYSRCYTSKQYAHSECNKRNGHPNQQPLEITDREAS